MGKQLCCMLLQKQGGPPFPWSSLKSGRFLECTGRAECRWKADSKAYDPTQKTCPSTASIALLSSNQRPHQELPPTLQGSPALPGRGQEKDSLKRTRITSYPQDLPASLCCSDQLPQPLPAISTDFTSLFRLTQLRTLPTNIQEKMKDSEKFPEVLSKSGAKGVSLPPRDYSSSGVLDPSLPAPGCRVFRARLCTPVVGISTISMLMDHVPSRLTSSCTIFPLQEVPSSPQSILAAVSPLHNLAGHQGSPWAQWPQDPSWPVLHSVPATCEVLLFDLAANGPAPAPSLVSA